MKYFIITLLAAIAFTGCKTKNDGFSIIGHIEGIKDSTLITLYDLDQQINLDSAYSSNGNFTLSGKVEHPSSCWIQCENEYANIQVENLEMSFHSPLKNMHLNCSISGGKEQDLQNELKNLQQVYDQAYMDALDHFMKKKYSSDEEKLSLIMKINESQSASHDVYVDFGKKHADSYMGLNIVYKNRNSIERDTLTAIYENLPPAMKNTSTAKALNVYLFEEVAKVGNPFIDFEVSTIDGDDFRLSSLKGEYIYLCFWSAGCGPCRMENKYLSKHFTEIPENLSIVSFSVDKNANTWKSASESDRIFWHNISDMEGSKGRIKTQYQVQAIPTSFLIDKNGTIIKKFKGFDPKGNIIEKLKKMIDELE
jgi:peroxiredoxin